MLDKDFKVNAIKKFISLMLSIKVWTIFILMGLTTLMVFYGKMTGGEFAAVNGGVISTVFGLREGFKIAVVNSKKEEHVEQSKNLTP